MAEKKMRRVSEGEVRWWRCVVATDDVKVAETARQRLTRLSHTSAASARPLFGQAPRSFARQMCRVARPAQNGSPFCRIWRSCVCRPDRPSQRVCYAKGSRLIRSQPTDGTSWQPAAAGVWPAVPE